MIANTADTDTIDQVLALSHQTNPDDVDDQARQSVVMHLIEGLHDDVQLAFSPLDRVQP